MNNQRLSVLRAKKGYHILPVKTGQMLEVHEKVWQWNNERIWKFKWLVIKVKKPNHVDGTFIMRGKVAGQTVEKIYPLSFGKFAKVLLVDHYRTRRAKLYYIRDKVGKDARMKSLATAEEKGVDLLALALAEATELNAPYAVKDEAPTPEQTEDAAPEVGDTPAEEAQETTSDDSVDTETPKTETAEETSETQE